MLVTKQPVLRRFWYAVMPMDRLAAGPQPFTLLGENIVLWKKADGSPAAVRDLLVLMDAAGVTVLRLALHRPTLDDVFLTLTGRP